MKLYYYTSAECALDDFDNERIKLSEIGNVNDPKIRDEYDRVETHGLFVPIVLTFFDQETYAIKKGQII